MHAPYPSIPTDKPNKLPAKAKLVPIPFRISPDSDTAIYAASAMRLNMEASGQEYKQDTSRVLGQRLDQTKQDIFQQIYLLPTPYHDVFQEIIDITHWDK